MLTAKNNVLKNPANLSIDELLEEHIKLGIDYQVKKAHYSLATAESLDQLENKLFEVEQEIKNRLKKPKNTKP